MQAHALTPRLVAALENSNSIADSRFSPLTSSNGLQPEFPFLSILASGGHTLLIRSESLVEHHILGTTGDIAVGVCLDKVARAVLPPDILNAAQTTMYGALLEDFAFSSPGAVIKEVSKVEGEQPEVSRSSDATLELSTAAEYQAIYKGRYKYTVPKNNEEAIERNTTKWGWTFNEPLTKAAGGTKRRTMEMSFSGLMTAVERAVYFEIDAHTRKPTKLNRAPEDISVEERRDMAREAMRAAFEHIANRVILGLQQSPRVTTVVMAGGVAANTYLRFMYGFSYFSHLNPTDTDVDSLVFCAPTDSLMLTWYFRLPTSAQIMQP